MSKKKTLATLQQNGVTTYVEIISNYNYNVDDAINYEHPTGESETVPDQSMSIQEILRNHVRGIPMDVSLGQAVYYGEEFVHDYDELKRLDLTEAHEMMSYLKDRIAFLQQNPVEAKNQSDEVDKPQVASANIESVTED